MRSADANSLCLECGLCCNGVIFADGQLQSRDDAARLRLLGLALLKNEKFRQPCAAFDGCRCRIYSERPNYCREFECLLLKSVRDGRTRPGAAVRIVRTARRRVQKVKTLLRELGDDDEGVALNKRFRRMQRRLEKTALDERTAEVFSRLTLAVHDLNLLLAEAFYPGS